MLHLDFKSLYVTFMVFCYIFTKLQKNLYVVWLLSKHSTVKARNVRPPPPTPKNKQTNNKTPKKQNKKQSFCVHRDEFLGFFLLSL